MRNAFNYKVGFLLFLLACSLHGLKSNEIIKNAMYQLQKEMVGSCELKASDVDWCHLPNGQNSTHIEDDMVSFPSSTKCALRNNKTTDTCQICHKNSWYDTTCGKDFNSHREKRNDDQTYIGGAGLIGAGIGFAIGGPPGGAIGMVIGVTVGFICKLFCKKKAKKPYIPPEIRCPELPSYEYFTSRKKLTIVVRWSEPTGNDGNGNALNPVQISGKKSGSTFERGYHTILYKVTDAAGTSASCFWSFKVTVRTCVDPRFVPSSNSRILCTSPEIIWGSQCSIKCDRGYELTGGFSVVTCDRNGKYLRPLGYCKAKTCPKLPTLKNGNPYACTQQRNYRSVCTTSCKNGYKIQQLYTRCTAAGTWQLPLPYCQDIEDPEFTDCPLRSKVIYNNPGQLTATLSYEEPKATDNSGKVTVKRQTGLAMGEDVHRGIYTIQYKAEDAAGNTAYCSLYIRAEVLECESPGYNDNNLKITCDSSQGRYPYGTKCTNSCPSDGHNLQGAENVICIKDNSVPPRTSWQIQDGYTEPSCLFVKCNNIKAPLEGALVCDTLSNGRFCSILCNENFDIPRTESFSKVYTCGENGQWVPPYTNPECSAIRHPTQFRVPVELTFRGVCSSSEDIRPKFVNVLLADPTFSNRCVTAGCSIGNVEIWCNGRKIENERVKRETGELMVKFDITIPFTLNGESRTNSTRSHAAKLGGLSDLLKAYVEAGGLNNTVPGLTYVADSLKIGVDDFVCPDGQKADYATAACRGCPRGMMYNAKIGDCSNCPIGSYQDETASLSCKLCPNGTSTVEEGTRNSSLCLAKCPIGMSSPTGLEPCGSCPQGTYQDRVGNTTCNKCPNEMTSGTGSTAMADCNAFDVVLTGPVQLQSNTSSDAKDFHITVWFKFITRSIASAFTINLKRNGNDILTLGLGQNAYVSMSRNFELGGMNLTEQWNHCILTWNQSTRIIGVYIGGKLVKSKIVSSVTSGLLEANTTMGIDVAAGNEIIIRRIQLSSSGLLNDDSIRDLSKSCELTIPTHPLISMSDLKSDNQNSSNLRIVVPSSCDANNECSSSPCGQHICIDEIGGFRCHCIKGYTGEMCSIAPDYCLSNGCMNGATCINDLQYGIFTCDCSQNFTGRLCDVAIVHGGLGEWGDWSQCSTTCGGGKQSRTRICDNPIPAGGGDLCKGIVSSIRTCNNNECPKCLSSDLIWAYGTNIDCNGDVSELVCKGTCDPGTAFIGDQPTYNCTYGVWTPGTQAEPCIDVLSPDDLQINATLEFPFVPCDKRGDFKNMVSNKISQDTCSGNGLCNSEIKVPECDRTNRRRREATTTVHIILTKTLPGGDLNIQAYQINGTVSPQLQAIVEAVQVLEISGQTLQNETDNYNFEVNGEKYKASSVNIVGSTMCQDGAIGASGICVLCPEGTYQNVEICTLCERGYYQDERGKTDCKSCPNGWSTQYTGSMNLTKCSIPSVMTPGEPKEENTDLIIIIATVVGCIVLLAILIIAFIYIKKRRAQKDKAFDSRPTSPNEKVDFEMETSSTLPSKDHLKE